MPRTFLIPMQPPDAGARPFTPQGAWRAKYVIELGLSAAIRKDPDRQFCLAEVSGDPQQLDALAACEDVVELTDDARALTAGTRLKVASLIKGMSLGNDSTGRMCITSLKLAIQDKQVAKRPVRLGDAVRDAIRG
jgi:hypothetical protein